MNFGQRIANGILLVGRSCSLPFVHPKLLIYGLFTLLTMLLFGAGAGMIAAGSQSGSIALMTAGSLVFFSFPVMIWFTFALQNYVLSIIKGSQIGFGASFRLPFGRIVAMIAIMMFFQILTQIHGAFFIVQMVFSYIIAFASIAYIIEGYEFGESIKRGFVFFGRGIIEIITWFIGLFFLAIPLVLLTAFSVMAFVSLWSPQIIAAPLGTAVMVKIAGTVLSCITIVTTFFAWGMLLSILPLTYSYLANDKKLPLE